jgi:LuxR family maltose regulon positive regulatory protein
VAADAIEQFDRGGVLPPVAGTVLGMVGLVEYEWNQLEQARRYIEQGIQLNKLGGHNAGIVFATVMLARVAQAEGDMERANRLAQEAADLLAFGVPAWVKPEVLAQQVRLYLAQNNSVLAEVALKQYPRSLQEASLHPDEPFFIAYLHLWLHQAHAGGPPEILDQALALAERVVAEASQFQRAGIAVQGLLVRAQLHALLGNLPASQTDLTQALRLAQREEYIRTFVDEGPALAALLKGLQNQNVLPNYVRKLLAAFAADEAGPSPAPEQSGLVEPLSERELEVLGLMSEGLTNPDIAKRLVISLSTVKTHLNNIYGKLSVRNRAEAVLRAKELGLL